MILGCPVSSSDQSEIACLNQSVEADGRWFVVRQYWQEVIYLIPGRARQCGMSAASSVAFCLLALLMGLNQPVGGAEADDEIGSAYFETHIRPLFAARCYQCHSERADRQEGGLLLDRQSGWLKGGERGASVVPGDVDASLLIEAVRFKDSELAMPPSEQLSSEEIQHLERWVWMGAPGPRDGQVHEIDDPSDPVKGKEHWAFKPLSQEPPPVVKETSWPRNAIDQYVLAEMENAGLEPVGDAEPKDLLRRISFQLHGTPPPRDLSEDFLSGPRSGSVERLVDRLLASPRFGERWGRHWLDLARYADSNGLDENFLFREAWRYRNWVIDAMNADLAYDRFLTEQIAGDLLPYDSVSQRDQQRIAAGFLVIGPKVLLGIPKDQQRMDVADEHIDTIGRAVLGQTLGCARCHDHKFDPVPTSDYYALAGIFSSTKVMESRYMLGQQRVMEQLIGLGPDGDIADDAYEKYWREQPKLKQRKQHAESALKMLQKKRDEAFARLLKTQSEAVSEAAKDESLSHEVRVESQQKFVAEIKTRLANPAKIPPRAMIPVDQSEPADEAIRVAGQVGDLGEVVPRGFLTVLCDDSRLTIQAGQSGRLELAQWLTDRDSRAGHLAARVLANRIWQHLIGRGLVRTVDNFGRTGEGPSHKALLDYLARRLLDSGWSIKSLVREIVLSRTFALSCRADAASFDRDPENRLLWRGNRRRLDPESLRDAMLIAAGQLDGAQYDSTVDYLGDQATAVGANKVRRRTDFPCRSVYLPVVRNDLPEIFEAFDFAEPHSTTGERPKTIVPSQGLFMLNDPMVMEASDATAKRILMDHEADDIGLRVERMFALILNEKPTAVERASVVAFLNRAEPSLRLQGAENVARDALAMACHALFASSRFQFLE